MMTSANNDIIASLKASNAQWAADVNKRDPAFFPKFAKGQAPKVLWIGCADSRVPESVILSRPPGDIFVHRNVANKFDHDDPSAVGLLQYAVENVGVEHIIVAGHTGCGGCIASYEGARGRLPISATSVLASYLEPVLTLSKEINAAHAKEHSIPLEKVDEHQTELILKLIEENVKRSVKNLGESEVMKEAWASGKNVVVHGWVYHLETGLVQDLNISVDKPSPSKL